MKDTVITKCSLVVEEVEIDFAGDARNGMVFDVIGARSTGTKPCNKNAELRQSS
jgi:hypothetical protein